jgi:TolA-binding protein
VKKAASILLIFLLAGCGNSLKHSWNNFTAYYNTFYNAKNNFKAGLSNVKQQPVQFFPDTLIFPHRIPPLAGREDFEQAERDAAQLLRRFPDSKWVNNAVLLMGKSYYYQHEFYKAQQKFEELLGLPDKNLLKQQAILWKGRILLNIHSYKSGIQSLRKALNTFDGKLKSQQKAKMYLLIAENQAKIGDWNRAAKFLNKSIPNISKHKLAGEAAFLLGQVYQKNKNYKEAFTAFSGIKKAHPGYTYSYWAGIKQIETARLQGCLQQAMKIASAMAGNNKNFHHRSEIYFQQAMNYKAGESYREAAAFFKKSLNDRGENLRRLKNQSYYQLGELYSKYLKNYDLSVAYFDSVSVQSMRFSHSKNNGRSRQLLSSYKRYAAFKKDIQAIDSLLKLGSLSKHELRKKLTSIKRKRWQANHKKEEVLPIQNRITHNDSEKYFNQSGSVNLSSQYGFLNYKNSQLVRQGKRKFAAVWGRRPMVDNWRRSEMLSGAAAENDSDNASKSLLEMNSISNNRAELDWSNIPRNDEARKKLKRQRISDRYKLGNLFFLNLDKPDSAAYYFHLTLDASLSKQMKSGVYYSLYKLYQANGKTDSVRAYKHKVLQEFPSSAYAKQIINSSGKADILRYSDSDSSGELLSQVHYILGKKHVSNNEEVALKLQKLAMKYRHDTAAPAIYLEGIRRYIKLAKKNDSALAGTDTLKSNSDIKHAYKGKYWDRVRTMLTKFRKTFPNASQQEQVNSWFAVLKSQGTEKKIRTCKELGIQPEIVGGKKQFLESIKKPENVKGMHIAGEIRFRFVIQKNGSISSIQLMSKPTKLGIEPVYVHAIRKSLHFRPVKVNGKKVKVSCIVSFPIKLK